MMEVTSDDGSGGRAGEGCARSLLQPGWMEPGWMEPVSMDGTSDAGVGGDGQLSVIIDVISDNGMQSVTIGQ